MGVLFVPLANSLFLLTPICGCPIFLDVDLCGCPIYYRFLLTPICGCPIYFLTDTFLAILFHTVFPRVIESLRS